jgi:NADPH-dependent FMN reductase
MPTMPDTPKLRVLVFAASLRADSFNRKLAALAARIAEQSGATVDLAAMNDFEGPSYDGDLEAAKGIPAGAAATNPTICRPSSTGRWRIRCWRISFRAAASERVGAMVCGPLVMKRRTAKR